MAIFLFYSILMAITLVKWQYFYSNLFSFRFFFFFFKSVMALCMKFVFVLGVVCWCQYVCLLPLSVPSVCGEGVGFRQTRAAFLRRLYWLWDSWSTCFLAPGCLRGFRPDILSSNSSRLIYGGTRCAVLRFFIHICFIYVMKSWCGPNQRHVL